MIFKAMQDAPDLREETKVPLFEQANFAPPISFDRHSSTERS
jgi:hypothetical protein